MGLSFFDLINPAASFYYNPFVYVYDDREVLTLIEKSDSNTTPSHSKSSDPSGRKSETALLQALMLYLLPKPARTNYSMVMEMISAAEVHGTMTTTNPHWTSCSSACRCASRQHACKQYRIFKQKPRAKSRGPFWSAWVCALPRLICRPSPS